MRDLRSYEPDIQPAEFRLADNTNAFGAAPSALEVIRRIQQADVVRYPTSYSAALRDAIGDYVGVSSEEIIVGCGSDDVLDCAFRTFAEPGERLALMDPTFVMARVFALTNGLTPVSVALLPDHDVDGHGMLATGARIAYLCSPNNPTGNRLSVVEVERVLTDFPGLVIADEAYAEYSGESLCQRAPVHGRLLVLRTFSKAFGLAGLRVGYGVGAAALIAELEKVRGPYKVSSLGEQAALMALRHDIPWMRETVAQTLTLRDRFVTALGDAGFAPFLSDANFVLLAVDNGPTTAQRLQASGVAVRPFVGLTGIGDAVRVTIGPWAAMERVIEALGRGP